MFEGRSRRAADETALNSVVDGKAPICPAERVRRQFKARTLGAASILTPRQNTRCASLDDLDPDLAAHVLDALEEPLEGKGFCALLAHQARFRILYRDKDLLWRLSALV
jgi:hypothetical protein